MQSEFGSNHFFSNIGRMQIEGSPKQRELLISWILDHIRTPDKVRGPNRFKARTIHDNDDDPRERDHGPLLPNSFHVSSPSRTNHEPSTLLTLDTLHGEQVDDSVKEDTRRAR